MTNWLSYLDLAYIHNLYEEGKLTIEQLGYQVSIRLRYTKYFKSLDPEFVDIVDEFEALDQISDIDDYDAALDLLYDFADEGYRIWINTKRQSIIPKPSSFDDTLRKYELEGKLSTDMYEWVKQAEPEYQVWLLERLRNTCQHTTDGKPDEDAVHMDDKIISNPEAMITPETSL